MNRPTPAFVPLAPFTWEVNFGLGPERREELRPELTDLLHRVFIDHPDYDRDYLPHFLAAEIYLRAFRGGDLAGHFISELAYVDGEPLLHLILALAEPGAGGRGRLMPQAMGLSLRLAVQAFGSEEFFVGLRTANPRVVAKAWDSP